MAVAPRLMGERTHGGGAGRDGRAGHSCRFYWVGVSIFSGAARFLVRQRWRGYTK